MSPITDTFGSFSNAIYHHSQTPNTITQAVHRCCCCCHHVCPCRQGYGQQFYCDGSQSLNGATQGAQTTPGRSSDAVTFGTPVTKPETNTVKNKVFNVTADPSTGRLITGLNYY